MQSIGTTQEIVYPLCQQNFPSCAEKFFGRHCTRRFLNEMETFFSCIFFARSREFKPIDQTEFECAVENSLSKNGTFQCNEIQKCTLLEVMNELFVLLISSFFTLEQLNFHHFAQHTQHNMHIACIFLFFQLQFLWLLSHKEPFSVAPIETKWHSQTEIVQVLFT